MNACKSAFRALRRGLVDGRRVALLWDAKESLIGVVSGTYNQYVAPEVWRSLTF